MNAKTITASMVFCALVLSMGTAMAGETGHYVNGVEGIKGATLPPPGLYLRVYNVFYSANTLTDPDGDKLDVDFDLDVWASATRVIWITDKTFLGGFIGMDAILPTVNSSIEIGALGVDEHEFGISNIWIEPITLSWHKPRYDASLGFGVYLPNGEHGGAAGVSKNFWTAMFTAGSTVYFDKSKSWSASILARYEMHSENEDTNNTPGDDFHFEWGVGKAIKGAWMWDVGVAGYCHWQVSDDSDDDPMYMRKVKDQVFAAGPEIGAFIPKYKTFLNLRSQWEFDAEDRPEGNVTTFTITKIF